MPGSIPLYLDLLDEQREAIFHELGSLPDAVLWYRPGPRVWSIGEHLDHTRVHNCCSRRFLPLYKSSSKKTSHAREKELTFSQAQLIIFGESVSDSRRE